MWPYKLACLIPLSVLFTPSAGLPANNSACNASSDTSVAASELQVHLKSGMFQGVAGNYTNNYLGIPYGKAKRYEVAKLLKNKLPGVQNATTLGARCMQQPIILPTAPAFPELNSLIGVLIGGSSATQPPPESEDCLFINVQTPKNITSRARLPVAVYIHGGAFANGQGGDVSDLVRASVEKGKPIIAVSFNYRLNAFGTLPGQEVIDAGISNLFLRDQRLALHWVQQNIKDFGGDPTRVMIWGESAGSISIALQMLLNDGDPEGLFRGAMMFSGGPLRLSPLTSTQHLFDDAAAYVGCSDANDKLEYVRRLYLSRASPIFTEYECPATIPFKGLADFY